MVFQQSPATVDVALANWTDAQQTNRDEDLRLQLPPVELCIEIVTAYFRYVHDPTHQMFHYPSFISNLRRREVPQSIILAIIALGARLVQWKSAADLLSLTIVKDSRQASASGTPIPGSGVSRMREPQEGSWIFTSPPLRPFEQRYFWVRSTAQKAMHFTSLCTTLLLAGRHV